VPAETQQPNNPTTKQLTLLLASILYLSEGLPYGIVNELAPLYLRVMHVPLAEITRVISLAGFAWTAKFLWSPLIEFGTYRRWIAGALAVITLLLTALATSAIPFAIVLIVLAIASATQDIAIDAFTIRITPNALVGPVNSIRVTAYRVAIIVAGGGLAAVAGYLGWRVAFAGAAIVSALIFAFTFTMPDDRGTGTAKATGQAGEPVLHWFRRPRAFTLLALVLLYRLGEFAIVLIIKPYWVDRGYSVQEIGTITTTIGATVVILGAFAGGAFVARFGVWSALLWMGFAQVISNIGYALVATLGAGRWGIYAASIAENLGYGLGNAAFLAFLMVICDKERAATEYALLSALFGLSRMIMGYYSGPLAQSLGYAPFFWLTVFLGIPALLLLPRVKRTLA
jgi:PAT family beta-lactamase induction signal transducer AmpG